jgi:hypothetical protein
MCCGLDGCTVGWTNNAVRSCPWSHRLVEGLTMTMDQLDPVVFDLLTEDVSISDDGSDRNVQDWVDSEIFGSNARMNVESVSEGRSRSRRRLHQRPLGLDAHRVALHHRRRQDQPLRKRQA